MSLLLQCYNKSCGQKFDPENNKDDACQYHPGVPVFHDALKGWSCCKRRSTDFTEFLNTPGCTKGLHSNVKPAEPEKPRVVEDIPEEKTIVQTPVNKPIAVVERPAVDEPFVRLPATVGASLKQALEKRLKEMSLNSDKRAEEANNVKEGPVQPGTSCKNNSCKCTYVDENSNQEVCVYHPGVPIFHEGCKFWSCCIRKTSDFDAFLNQEGCETGKHVWFKAENELQKKAACRFDWHQTGSHVIISVFSKVCDPDKSYVEVNQVSSKIYIVFDDGKSIFDKDIVLNGVIDIEKSNVKMLGTKVEITLKKAHPGSWSRLELPAVISQDAPASNAS